jgi:hypothetical protein
MERDLLARLKKIYNGEEVKRDVFGRRPATGAEVERTIFQSDDFAQQERFYPPSQADIDVKEERLRRRHHTKKPR